MKQLQHANATGGRATEYQHVLLSTLPLKPTGGMPLGWLLPLAPVGLAENHAPKDDIGMESPTAICFFLLFDLLSSYAGILTRREI